MIRVLGTDVRIWIETRLAPEQRAALATAMADLNRPADAWPLDRAACRFAVDAACTRHINVLRRAGHTETAAIRVTAAVVGLRPATLERRIERRGRAFATSTRV